MKQAQQPQKQLFTNWSSNKKKWILIGSISINLFLFVVAPAIFFRSSWFKSWLREEMSYLFSLQSTYIDFDDINVLFPISVTMTGIKISDAKETFLTIDKVKLSGSFWIFKNRILIQVHIDKQSFLEIETTTTLKKAYQSFSGLRSKKYGEDPSDWRVKMVKVPFRFMSHFISSKTNISGQDVNFSEINGTVDGTVILRKKYPFDSASLFGGINVLVEDFGFPQMKFSFQGNIIDGLNFEPIQSQIEIENGVFSPSEPLEIQSNIGGVVVDGKLFPKEELLPRKHQVTALDLSLEQRGEGLLFKIIKQTFRCPQQATSQVKFVGEWGKVKCEI
jgi:hypothetical protein